MSTPRDLAIPLQRVTWRDGQTLLSSDLSDDMRYSDRLRHLHVRYLHRTWGVVEGLEVSPLGADAVLVGPGYALDIVGCELLQPLSLRFSVPADIAQRTTMYLVFWRGAKASACAPTPDLAALCPGVGNPVPLQAGELAWKTVTEVRPGSDVLLARLLIERGRLASAIDTSVQRRAATLDRPRVWSDTTQEGQTGWTDAVESGLLEIQATVDASDAGFTTTPAYFARLTGASPTAAGFIASARPASFTFVVRVGVVGAIASGPDAAQAENDGWSITWLAIELPSGRAR